MFDSRPTEPPGFDLPDECPVCGRENADDEGELLLPSGCCCAACERKGLHPDATYSGSDLDDARYVGDGEHGVYYSVGDGPGGWYLSLTVYCPHFTADTCTDDGPYESEAAAWEAGRGGGIDWCMDNQVSWEDEEDQT